MSPLRHRTPSEPIIARDQMARTVMDHRQGLRSFLALFAATRVQIDAAEALAWDAWLTQPSTASAAGVRAGLQRLAADAIARQLDASAASAIAGHDPLIHLLSQSGREALEQPTAADAGIAHQVQARVAALDLEQRDLLLGRYRDRLANTVLADRLGWSTARVDARLVSARAAVDWMSPAEVLEKKHAPEQEGLLPTLIEDQLTGAIDADSRSLLVKRMIDDLQFASHLERQARLDLVLAELLTPVSEADAAVFATHLLARTSDLPQARMQSADPRRSSPPPAARRRPPMQLPVVGGILAAAVVMGGVLLLMARPTTSTNRDTVDSTRSAPRSERPTAMPQLAAEPSRPILVAQVAPPPVAPPPVRSPPIASVTLAPTAPAADPVTVVATSSPAPLPVPTAIAVSTPASATVALTSKPVFVKGLHFGGDAVTIDGNRWQSQKQAEGDGLNLKNARRVMVTMAPVPAVDADIRALLSSGITTAKSEPLGIGLALPDGDYEVTAWMMENQRANSRLFDLDVGGVVLANLGDLPLGGWAAYGPCTVAVHGGRLDIAAKARRGTPLLMGITVHRTAAAIGADAAKSYVADFSTGVAKDWTPLAGAWSVADGHYRHTSAENVELSVYDGASWGDVSYSAAMHPYYDNGYGLVFGAQDAQTYDAVFIVKSTASLLRVVKGAKTEVAQAACVGTRLFAWSEVAVTRIGRKVSVTINGASVFSEIDLGEPASGKLGLFTSWNPVDFAKIKAALPKR